MPGECEELRAALDAQFKDHADTVRLLKHYMTENRLLQAVVASVQRMIDVGTIDRYQPESYSLVETLAELRKTIEHAEEILA